MMHTVGWKLKHNYSVIQEKHLPRGDLIECTTQLSNNCGNRTTLYMNVYYWYKYGSSVIYFFCRAQLVYVHVPVNFRLMLFFMMPK